MFRDFCGFSSESSGSETRRRDVRDRNKSTKKKVCGGFNFFFSSPSAASLLRRNHFRVLRHDVATYDTEAAGGKKVGAPRLDQSEGEW